jgi:hypothetical protein
VKRGARDFDDRILVGEDIPQEAQDLIVVARVVVSWCVHVTYDAVHYGYLSPRSFQTGQET